MGRGEWSAAELRVQPLSSSAPFLCTSATNAPAQQRYPCVRVPWALLSLRGRQASRTQQRSWMGRG